MTDCLPLPPTPTRRAWLQAVSGSWKFCWCVWVANRNKTRFIAAHVVVFLQVSFYNHPESIHIWGQRVSSSSGSWKSQNIKLRNHLLPLSHHYQNPKTKSLWKFSSIYVLRFLNVFTSPNLFLHYPEGVSCIYSQDLQTIKRSRIDFSYFKVVSFCANLKYRKKCSQEIYIY